MRGTLSSFSITLLAAAMLLLWAPGSAVADDHHALPSPLTLAAESSAPAPSPSLLVSADREVQLLVATSRATQGWSPHVAGSTKTWIHRHPVWFGALVGAAVGGVPAGLAWGSEGVWVGVLAGGAVGAIVAAIVTR